LNITLTTLARLSAGLDIEAADLLSEWQPDKKRSPARSGRRPKAKGRKKR
jgi:hypothetical protein